MAPKNNPLKAAWGSAYDTDSPTYWTLFPQDLWQLAGDSLNPSEILLLLILKTFAGTSNIVFPGLTKLAELCGDGEDHSGVSKNLKSLADKGWIKKLPPEKKGKRTQYDLDPVFAKLAWLREAAAESAGRMAKLRESLEDVEEPAEPTPTPTPTSRSSSIPMQLVTVPLSCYSRPPSLDDDDRDLTTEEIDAMLFPKKSKNGIPQ